MFGLSSSIRNLVLPLACFSVFSLSSPAQALIQEDMQTFERLESELKLLEETKTNIEEKLKPIKTLSASLIHSEHLSDFLEVAGRLYSKTPDGVVVGDDRAFASSLDLFRQLAEERDAFHKNTSSTASAVHGMTGGHGKLLTAAMAVLENLENLIRDDFAKMEALLVEIKDALVRDPELDTPELKINEWLTNRELDAEALYQQAIATEAEYRERLEKIEGQILTCEAEIGTKTIECELLVAKMEAEKISIKREVADSVKKNLAQRRVYYDRLYKQLKPNDGLVAFESKNSVRNRQSSVHYPQSILPSGDRISSGTSQGGVSESQTHPRSEGYPSGNINEVIATNQPTASNLELPGMFQTEIKEEKESSPSLLARIKNLKDQYQEQDKKQVERKQQRSLVNAEFERILLDRSQYNDDYKNNQIELQRQHLITLLRQSRHAIGSDVVVLFETERNSENKQEEASKQPFLQPLKAELVKTIGIDIRRVIRDYQSEQSKKKSLPMGLKMTVIVHVHPERLMSHSKKEEEIGVSYHLSYRAYFPLSKQSVTETNRKSTHRLKLNARGAFYEKDYLSRIDRSNESHLAVVSSIDDLKLKNFLEKLMGTEHSNSHLRAQSTKPKHKEKSKKASQRNPRTESKNPEELDLDKIIEIERSLEMIEVYADTQIEKELKIAVPKVSLPVLPVARVKDVPSARSRALSKINRIIHQPISIQDLMSLPPSLLNSALHTPIGERSRTVSITGSTTGSVIHTAVPSRIQSRRGSTAGPTGDAKEDVLSPKHQI